MAKKKETNKAPEFLTWPRFVHAEGKPSVEMTKEQYESQTVYKWQL